MPCAFAYSFVVVRCTAPVKLIVVLHLMGVKCLTKPILFCIGELPPNHMCSGRDKNIISV